MLVCQPDCECVLCGVESRWNLAASYMRSRNSPSIKVLRAEVNVNPVSPLATQGDSLAYRAMSHVFRGRVVVPSAGVLARFRMEVSKEGGGPGHTPDIGSSPHM